MTRDKGFDIICGASLHWDTSLFQRPHQIMSRLAQKHTVLYIRPIDWLSYYKYPDIRPQKRRFDLSLEKLKLYSPLILPFSRVFPWIRSFNNLLMKHRIKRECQKKNNKKNILWLYSPLSAYLIGNAGEALVVYDCMDEHVTFKNADPKLVEAENQILEKANIVFAGGRSLYESKKLKNPNCYLFPSCVDTTHFSKALSSDTLVPNDLKDIPKPVIGYSGAVDERLDYKLIERLAEKNSDFSFVFVGPIIKVQKKNLPVKKNIYYLGAKEYHTLPSYLKGFDIGFMPFALSPVTKMISPTKTLEYLAAGCRVVSTPVPDVVSDFKRTVRIGHNADEISNHLREVVNNKEPAIIRLGKETAAKNTWDGMVDKMEQIITEKL